MGISISELATLQEHARQYAAALDSLASCARDIETHSAALAVAEEEAGRYRAIIATKAKVLGFVHENLVQP